jgi:CRISPR-associated protein Csm2
MQDYQNKNYQSSGYNKYSHKPGFAGEEIPRPSKDDYKSQWITSSADSTLVDYAEKAGRFMAKKGLTNSKIRSIYGEIKRIQMSEFEKEKSAFILLKPKVAYALGRDANNEGLKLFKEIFDLSSTDVTDQKSYQNFCNFMEAILAYHKAFGGKD